MQRLNVTFTSAAEKFVSRLLRFDGGPGSGLRLRVSAGGCSGLASEFSVEKAPAGGEGVFEHKGLKFFLPAESRLLLDGVTIDFVDTPAKTGFVFTDPKAKSCACSSESASVPDLHDHTH
jgi:iron-sulfur cluster assembly protein